MKLGLAMEPGLEMGVRTEPGLEMGVQTEPEWALEAVAELGAAMEPE